MRFSEIAGETGIFVDGDWIEKKDQDAKGAVRLIQLADVGPGEFRDKSDRHITVEKADELHCTFLRKGDILIARLGDPLCKACVFPLDGLYITAVDVAILRIGSDVVNPKYLIYLLNSPWFKDQVKQYESGTTRKRISRKNLDRIEMIFPPLPEQERIVARIEELFSQLDAGVETLKKTKAQLAVYRQAVLKEAFEGRLTQAFREENGLPDWKTISITQAIVQRKNALKAGPFGSALKKECYVPSGYKVYGQEQVIANNENIGNYYIDEEKYQELISCAIAPHDILISLVGTVGKVLVLSDNCLPGIINPRLIKVTLDEKIMMPYFFKYYFESAYLKSLYKKKAHGATMDVLNMGMIKELPFPLCDIQEQGQVIKEIESRLSVCDSIEQTVDTALQQAEAMRQSILKDAFEGKM